MFRITENPSSVSLVKCLAKITKMVLSCPLAWTWLVLWQHILTRCVCVCSSLYIQRTTHTHTQQVTICCHNTDPVHVNGHDRTKLVICSYALYKAP